MSKANTRVIDLPENINPNGLENLYLATDTTDEKITLNGIKSFLSKVFVEKGNNLSDIDPIEVRKNLNIFSKEEIKEKLEEQNQKHVEQKNKNIELENKNLIQDEKIKQLETKNAEQDHKLREQEVENTLHGQKIQEIEKLNKEQNNIIKALEDKNAEQDTEIAEIKKKNTEQDKKITAIETKSTKQEEKIIALETKNTEQDAAINKKANAVHTHNVNQISDFNEKVYENLKSKIIAGQNITITEETGKIKITSTGGGSGGGYGDMMKSIYDRDNDGKVDIAKTAENVHWDNVTDKPNLTTSWNDLQNKPTTFAPNQHNHSISEIINLQTTLNNKANTSDLVNKQNKILLATVESTNTEVNKIAIAERSPEVGDIILAIYTQGTAVNNATLNINSTGAKNIRIQNSNANGQIHRTAVNGVIMYYYDGVYYHMIGSQFNALYSAMSITEAKTGTATTNRYITAQVLKEMAKRENHSGTQEISTIIGLQTALNNKVDVEVGKGLSSNDFSDELKLKLKNVGDGGFVNISNVVYENGVWRSFEANGKNYSNTREDGKIKTISDGKNTFSINRDGSGKIINIIKS